MSAAHLIGMVGAGRVARALSRALSVRGWRVAPIDSRAPLGGARTLLIAVADDALAEVAAALAKVYSTGDGVALHTTGAHGAEILAPLAAKGFDCGTLHPLQTISDSNSDVLEGVAFAISGGKKAIAFAEQIVADLGGRALHIRPEQRAMYHAAAVMASNYITALIHAAEQLLQLAGVTGPEARRALSPLIRQSVENSLEQGPAKALTGPIRRGDAGTVAVHLAALRSAPGSLEELYRACGMVTVDVAREGGLAADLALQIETLLKCTTL
jgi:predicted short-subunit dehydrogenase-like oxidoreductase (DUF2520 family)